ncbi:MAG: hypothetical protein ACWGSD_10450 [Thermodesulfobacteriota bacterium]
MAGNDHFFLSLSIAHAKATLLAVESLGSGSVPDWGPPPWSWAGRCTGL